MRRVHKHRHLPPIRFGLDHYNFLRLLFATIATHGRKGALKQVSAPPTITITITITITSSL